MPAWPFVRIADRASYSNNQTREHDAVAMRYLSYVLYPLVVGYSIYTLVYETHRSWYIWLPSSLVGAVDMFGFILMCPQVSCAACNAECVPMRSACSVVLPAPAVPRLPPQMSPLFIALPAPFPCCSCLSSTAPLTPDSALHPPVQSAPPTMVLLLLLH